jgi:hypothetical protein
MLRLLLCTVVLAALPVSVAAAAAAPLTIAVTAQSVTVANATKGGSIVLFSCARYSRYRSIGVRPEARVLRDDDGDGVVRFAADTPIPIRSVWVAVDQTSGNAVAGAPADFPLLVSPLGAGDLRKDVQGEIASLAAALPRLIVLLVSPGKGAWVLAAFDGEATDRDTKKDGHILLSFSDARAVDGKDKPPNQVKKDDVVVAIDPGHLDVFITQVGK